jgi:hypothetical protein
MYFRSARTTEFILGIPVFQLKANNAYPGNFFWFKVAQETNVFVNKLVVGGLWLIPDKKTTYIIDHK